MLITELRLTGINDTACVGKIKYEYELASELPHQGGGNEVLAEVTRESGPNTRHILRVLRGYYLGSWLKSALILTNVVRYQGEDDIIVTDKNLRFLRRQNLAKTKPKPLHSSVLGLKLQPAWSKMTDGSFHSFPISTTLVGAQSYDKVAAGC